MRMTLGSMFLSAAAVAALTIASVVGVVSLVDDRRPWVILVTTTSTMLLILAPAIAGLMTANLNVGRDSDAAARIIRRLVLDVAGIQLVGILGLLFVAVAAPEPTVLLAVVAATSVLLLVASVRLGIGQARARHHATRAQAWRMGDRA